MGYSGLIYAVIVAGWAALLAPRWIRRNEEIERAREADAARGVRVLERRQGRVRGGHVSASARALGRASFSGRSAPAASKARAHAGPPAQHSERSPAGPGLATAESDDESTTAGYPAPGPARRPGPQRASAAARRRRTLTLLTLIMAVVLALAMSGTISVWWSAAPFVLLLTFVLIARRAVVIENRRARAARIAARRRELAEPPPKRVAVYQPDVSPPDDPDGWTPQPVPRPTYLSKPKASPPQGRRIDLPGAGAWTSGRLASEGAQDYPGRRAQAPRNRPGGDDFGGKRAMGD